MRKSNAEWTNLLTQIDKVKNEKQELEAQVAIMRDALIQSLYALEALKDNPEGWSDMTDRALTSVNWVLSSDAGHEFLESYVRMQKALTMMKANQLLDNIALDENKNLH